MTLPLFSYFFADVSSADDSAPHRRAPEDVGIAREVSRADPVVSDPVISDPAELALVRAIAHGDETALRSALSAVPRSDRSISEVIIVWNADWSPVVAGADAPLALIRDNVRETLSELPTDCLGELVEGPRLIPVDTDNGTTFLAIGSGSWRWIQLLENDNNSDPLDGISTILQK